MRRRTDPAGNAIDLRIERGKHIALVLLTTFVTAAFIGYCLYIVLAHAGSADDIKWATSILAGIMGSLLGYFIKRSRWGDKT